MKRYSEWSKLTSDLKVTLRVASTVLLLWCLGNISSVSAQDEKFSASVTTSAMKDDAELVEDPNATSILSNTNVSENASNILNYNKSSPLVNSNIGNALSPIALFFHADIVGKSVILLLIFGSLLSWSLWLWKTGDLWHSSRGLKRSIQLLSETSTLQAMPILASEPCNQMLALARGELHAFNGKIPRTAETIKERVQAKIQRIEMAEARSITCGANLLATLSAVAPFVGLFGTVWGIMHSFISIADSQSTKLSVVAPGIAESLFATALGLVVAIPAVIFYNLIVRQISGYRQRLSDANTLVMCYVSQELDLLVDDYHHEVLASVA